MNGAAGLCLPAVESDAPVKPEGRLGAVEQRIAECETGRRKLQIGFKRIPVDEYGRSTRVGHRGIEVTQLQVSIEGWACQATRYRSVKRRASCNCERKTFWKKHRRKRFPFTNVVARHGHMQRTAIGERTRRPHLSSRSARGQIGDLEIGRAKPVTKMRAAGERKFARGDAGGAGYCDRRVDFGILD